MKVVNLTKHSIIVRTPNGDIEFTPSGQVAHVTAMQEIVGDVNGISIVKTTFGQVEGVPDPAGDTIYLVSTGDTIYLVSTLVAQALAGRSDIIAPDTGPTAIRVESSNEKGEMRDGVEMGIQQQSEVHISEQVVSDAGWCVLCQHQAL